MEALGWKQLCQNCRHTEFVKIFLKRELLNSLLTHSQFIYELYMVFGLVSPVHKTSHYTTSTVIHEVFTYMDFITILCTSSRK